jgi:hypothetical protein
MLLIRLFSWYQLPPDYELFKFWSAGLKPEAATIALYMSNVSILMAGGA